MVNFVIITTTTTPSFAHIFTFYLVILILRIYIKRRYIICGITFGNDSFSTQSSNFQQKFSEVCLFSTKKTNKSRQCDWWSKTFCQVVTLFLPFYSTCGKDNGHKRKIIHLSCRHKIRECLCKSLREWNVVFCLQKTMRFRTIGTLFKLNNNSYRISSSHRIKLHCKSEIAKTCIHPLVHGQLNLVIIFWVDSIIKCRSSAFLCFT